VGSEDASTVWKNRGSEKGGGNLAPGKRELKKAQEKITKDSETERKKNQTRTQPQNRTLGQTSFQHCIFTEGKKERNASSTLNISTGGKGLGTGLKGLE